MELTQFWNQRLNCAAVGQGAPLRIRLDVARPDNGHVEATLEDTYPPTATATLIGSYLRQIAPARPDRYVLRVTFYEQDVAPLCGTFDGTYFSATAMVRWLGKYYGQLAQQGGAAQRQQAEASLKTARAFLSLLLLG